MIDTRLIMANNAIDIEQKKEFFQKDRLNKNRFKSFFTFSYKQSEMASDLRSSK